jgi:probable HAF family extracellular repeat protein
MKHSLALLLVSVLSPSLASCFRDSPLEPVEQPASLAFAVATTPAVVSLIDLGMLGPGQSRAVGINDNGQIVGETSRPDSKWPHAFSWVNGTMTDLGTLGSCYGTSSAYAVSSTGQIVGWSAAAEVPTPTCSGDENYDAFSWRNGVMRKLPALPGRPEAFDRANGVNASGQIVGRTSNAPVLWQNGSVTDLGSLGGTRGSAQGINDQGQVVGSSETASGPTHAFIWQNGTMRDLGTLGGTHSDAQGINGSGQVVGSSWIPGSTFSHAFLWQNGTMRDLGTLGGSQSFAYGINDDGQVVGASNTSTGEMHGFVWLDGIMSDLGTLGGRSSQAYAINNAGQVVGYSNTTASSSDHAVRWTLAVIPWIGRAALPSARRSLAIGVVNGLLYAIGGTNIDDAALTIVQAYNPSTNAWTTRAPLPAPRQNTNGAAAINGVIYVPGGQNAAGVLTRTLYAYNASSNTWSAKASMPMATGCGGSAVIGAKLYVFGGCKKSSTGGLVRTAVLHRYDPSTNLWTTLSAPAVAHSQPVVGVIGGKLYVAGGSNATSVATARLDMYDPATNTWSRKAPMPTARVAMGGTAALGQLYVIGGRDNAGNYLTTLEAYDPATDQWRAGPNMPTARAGMAVGVINQKVYVVGGRYSTIDGNVLVATHQRYTP